MDGRYSIAVLGLPAAMVYRTNKYQGKVHF
jgi:hypothetical protein